MDLAGFLGYLVCALQKGTSRPSTIYIDVAKTQPEKFKLFTIACRDTIARVNEYMQQEHYSFPVAMANSSIVKEFNVKGYPTKILITPQGKYVKIPFSSDWLQFIKQYTGL